MLAREIPAGRFKCTLRRCRVPSLSRGRGKISHCFERQYCHRRRRRRRRRRAVSRHCSRLNKSLLGVDENRNAERARGWRLVTSEKYRVQEKCASSHARAGAIALTLIMSWHAVARDREENAIYTLRICGRWLPCDTLFLFPPSSCLSFFFFFFFRRTPAAEIARIYGRQSQAGLRDRGFSRPQSDRDWLLINCAARLINRLIAR